MVGPPIVMDSPSSVTVTQPKPQVWVLTMERKPDNRLSREMLALLLLRLDEVEAEWRKLNEGKEDKDKVGGALILASSITKFWSNGFIPAFLVRPGFKDGEWLLWSRAWPALRACPRGRPPEETQGQNSCTAPAVAPRSRR